MTDTQTPAPAAADERLEGIGGWLILPIIGLGLTILFSAINLAAAFAAENVQAYSDFFAGRLAPAADTYIYFGLGSGVLGIVLIAFAAVCLVRIFQMKRNVPTLMVIYYVVLVAVSTYEFVGMLSLPLLSQTDQEMYEGVRGFGQPIIAALVWIPYFLVSKRVKNTFVR